MTYRIRAVDLTPEQRKALSSFEDHFESDADLEVLAQLLDMGLLFLRQQGALCRTLAGEKVYDEMVATGNAA